MKNRPLPKLVVEGKNDQFAIIALLKRHDVIMDQPVRPLEIVIPKDPITGAEGWQAVLEDLSERIRNTTDAPVGFVLDIDESFTDRWERVRRKLQTVGIEAPGSCPKEGYLGTLPDYPHPFGIWLMPDCSRDHGTLENLLQSLIPEDNRLWSHARESTEQARTLEAPFRVVDTLKAQLHCWLAWQKKPGLPYGDAINNGYLGSDSPEALAFLGWLKKLYRLEGLKV